MRIIRIQLDRAGQEAVPPPRAHNTCTNILQLFQVVKIRGNTGLFWGKQKGDVGGKPLKAVESCALYLKAFKSFYILYYFFIIVAVYR
jgi:hypothetical protein